MSLEKQLTPEADGPLGMLNRSFSKFPPIANVKQRLSPISQKKILTIKGKTYRRSDILAYKKYFDSLSDSKTGKLTLEGNGRMVLIRIQSTCELFRGPIT